MLIPFRSNLRYWFYAIGNTPAVNFLRDTRLDKDEKVRILCLGCGDARGVLYTTWSNHDLYKELAFTVCDLDAAVLARNILLFATLLADKESAMPMQSLWNIYYHFYITKKDETYLLSSTAKLLEVSNTLEQWSSSAYGKIIRFSSLFSLQKIRAVWQAYSDMMKMKGKLKQNHGRKIDRR